MTTTLVRTRQLAAVALLAVSTLLGGCLGKIDSTLPPFTDPALQRYDTSTGVVIANMIRIDSTIYAQDVVEGTGRVLVEGDSAAVYYVGKLSTGFQFDGRTRPAVAYETLVDTTRLIRGWAKGLPGMRVGGTRRLAIGPASGYEFGSVRDNLGNVLIPPNSVLVFDVELVNVIDQP